MKYFFDTEFHETFFRKGLFGKKHHTIDFISIGLVAEDGRELYQISKDFDIKAAWNSYNEVDTGYKTNGGADRIYKKEYWLRQNVLLPIFKELAYKNFYETTPSNNEFIIIIDKLPEQQRVDFFYKNIQPHSYDTIFCLQDFMRLIKKYGKKNEQIARNIFRFINPPYISMPPNWVYSKPEFYAYFADYDWVTFCSLWGKMISLPNGYPKYCRDLKQMLDVAVANLKNSDFFTKFHITEEMTESEKLKEIKKNHPSYPVNEDEHNALGDAKWNKKLFYFIKMLDTK